MNTPQSSVKTAVTDLGYNDKCVFQRNACHSPKWLLSPEGAVRINGDFLRGRDFSMGRRRRRTARAATPHRRPLRLEPLEDRRLLAVVTVTTLADTIDFNDGVTSLREAIFATNTVPGADDRLRAGAHGRWPGDDLADARRTQDHGFADNQRTRAICSQSTPLETTQRPTRTTATAAGSSTSTMAISIRYDKYSSPVSLLRVATRSVAVEQFYRWRS